MGKSLFLPTRASLYLSLVAGLLLAASVSSHAAFEIQISEAGGPTIVAIDNAAFDFDPAVGTITFGTALPLIFGDFALSSLTATSSKIPLPGSLLTSASLTVKNFTPVPHTLTLTVGDTDYAFGIGTPLQLTSTGSGTFSVVGGTPTTSVLGSSAHVQTFGDASNAQFGTGFPAENFTFNALDLPVASYAASNTTSGFNPSGLYSLTMVDTFTLPGNTELVGGSDALVVQPIPEPATWVLIGCGLLPLARMLRRRAS